MEENKIYADQNVEFEEWVNDTHNHLFHINKTDIDEKTGIRLDRKIVLSNIFDWPFVLEHKSFSELFNLFDII